MEKLGLEQEIELEEILREVLDNNCNELREIMRMGEPSRILSGDTRSTREAAHWNGYGWRSATLQQAG
jgi:hypothetical protein